MRDVYIVAVGMTRFGKHMDRTEKDLVAEAFAKTMGDAPDIKISDIQSAFFSNTAWGFFNMQHSIRGQVALRPLGIEGIPITNVENACACASTALHCAYKDVAGGMYECSLAIGMEKLYNEDKAKTFMAFSSGVDVANIDAHMKALRDIMDGVKLDIPDDDGGSGAGKTRSAFMDVYASAVRWHMATFGTTQRQLAIIASKNHFHSSMNPNAQFQKTMTVEEILEGRPVVWPLTVPMCAPVGDGAAGAIVCSRDFLNKLKSARPVKILASVLGSGTNRKHDQLDLDIGVRLSRQAYNVAGICPEDISLAEVHDATAFGELHQCESLGFCKIGEGGPFAETGATKLGGKIPINTSGGLESRGHPVGASGLGMIHELVTQLRHEAGPRQVERCRLALGENGGGNIAFEEASMTIHILERMNNK
ncbi:MAG: thiolase [Deltaproteobacteria bacterium HGW-Deltaproteobacteria-2]|jgi:acetyl-CoA acetyltransferase|nr:MAG: thiolase [Deltaproteobacteria bacterium HGW-Deltaproteobacteria-2]